MSDQEQPRIGVYTCYCGGNISDTVQCERVRELVAKLPNVVVSRTDMSMCSDAGQALIEADIKEHKLNRVVVGACAPSLHEQTFRGTVARAGLNPYLYQHVGVREQDSWVHHHAETATEKAFRLIGAGIAKARQLDPLEPIELSAEKHALVIGGGVAGLRSAYDIARRGLHVTLIEKTPFLGGRMARLETVFPTGNNARDELHQLIDAVVSHPNVRVITSAELITLSGYVGDFHATVRQQSRGVVDGYTHADAAIAACPETVPDPYNEGLTERKAIYRAYDGCYPPTPAIDWANCTQCGLCQSVNGAGINLENNPIELDLNVGAIVVATGFKPYEPRHGEFGYGEHPQVITLPQFIRLLALNEGDTLQWQGKPVRNVALIHCVGSRQLDGVDEPQEDGLINEYCSRVCCTATLHAANELRQRFPGIHAFDVYEDIRTYGRGHEELYDEASARQVRFLRYHAEEPPAIVPDPQGDGVLVRVADYLTWGEELDVPADLVVLAVGMLPNNVDDLVDLLKIPKGSDRFLLEVHPKLQPVETVVPGVLLAGTAQSPMNIQEACAAASAAATKVAGLLSQGTVTLEPFVARVDPQRCTGSGECVAVCAYEDAIAVEEVEVDGEIRPIAVVTPANCSGCGACVAVCPHRAVDVQGWTLDQYEAMIDAIAADLPVMEVAS